MNTMKLAIAATSVFAFLCAIELCVVTNAHAQKYPSAVSLNVGIFQVFGLEPSEKSTIRHKIFVHGVWGPNSPMASEWGPTGIGPVGGFISSRPGVVAWLPTANHLFAVARDGTAYHKWFDPTSIPGWSTSSTGHWEKIGRGGSAFKGSIAAISPLPNQIQLVAIGANGKAYHKSWVGASWNPARTARWLYIGGGSGVALDPSPAMVSWSPNRLDILARGGDDKVYHKFFNVFTGTLGWGPNGPGKDWESIGGMPGAVRIIGSPAAVSWEPDRLDVFVTGNDGNIYHKFLASSWSATGPGSQNDDWESVGGPPGGQKFIAPPAAVSWGVNRLDIFAIADDGNAYHKFFDGAWAASGPGSLTGDWELIGGTGQSAVLSGTPAVVAWGANRLDIFATSKDAKAYHKFYDGDWGPVNIAHSWELISN